MVHARIDDGTLAAAAGPLPGADLIIETGPAIEALMSGEMTPAAAIASGSVQLPGTRIGSNDSSRSSRSLRNHRSRFH